jgi:hypothetical protein
MLTIYPYIRLNYLERVLKEVYFDALDGNDTDQAVNFAEKDTQK